jgi:phosphoribosylformimino-5-aminoimidazole carboxamide ribonucleotide (ProFAR) isomerase
MGPNQAKLSIIKYSNKLVNQTKLKIDFGGGLKSNADLKIALRVGQTKSRVEVLLLKTGLFSKSDEYG